MEDEKPPGEKAMADQQKPGEKAVSDQQQPGEKTVVDQQQAEARYPKKLVSEAFALLEEMTARLEEAPGVRDEMVGLLVGYGNGRVDAHAVVFRAADLLRGHPDVFRSFSAFVSGAKAPVPAEGLAATRPRRNNSRNSRYQSVPAEELDEAGGGGAGGGVQDYSSPKSKKESVRRHKPAAGAGGFYTDCNRDDPRFPEAVAFVKRVKEIAGDAVSRKFNKVLEDAGRDGGMVAEVIHDRARKALGPENAGLLHEFATEFLPGEKEWAEQQEEARRLARNRKRAGASTSFAGAAADAAGKQLSNGHVPFETVKKRSADDGNHHRGHALGIGESSGGGGEQGHDDNYAPLPRSRIKKPRTDDGNGHCSGSDAAAGVLINGDVHGYGYVDRKKPRRRGLNGSEGLSAAAPILINGDVHGNGYVDKKKQRRRAANGGEGCSAAAPPPLPEPEPILEKNHELYHHFRQLWEFYTGYSALVGTITRMEELLQGDDGGLPASVEELFPRREHREFLGNYYGDRWGPMRERLEGCEGPCPALKVLLKSLRQREEEAVAEEARRRRRDPARAAARLRALVTDMVEQEERRRWRCVGAGRV